MLRCGEETQTWIRDVVEQGRFVLGWEYREWETDGNCSRGAAGYGREQEFHYNDMA